MQATQLDELGDYQQQLMHFRQRLVLKGQLYSTPTDSLYQAAQIIEQVCVCVCVCGVCVCNEYATLHASRSR